MKKSDFKDYLEIISPIIIDPKPTSITIGLSKRFLLFDMLNKIVEKIEDDPHMNFISLLKQYKILGRILDGTIREFYRDRNRSYFRNFFIDDELWKDVKRDIKWVYHRNKNVNVTITKRGVIIYSNYQKNKFNTLLLTVHSGEWIPNDIQKKQTLSKELRTKIEDSKIQYIYGDIVLKGSGIWIDNKMSRFACDFNRPPDRAIYDNNSEDWIDRVWDEELTKRERKVLMQHYDEFYFTLSRLIETHNFNIIFDGHSMRHMKGRPAISFGTRYIPKFYMPIVRSMLNRMSHIGYKPVAMNKPFSGGYILKWLSEKFPDRFIFSMEINKRLYMKNNIKVNEDNIERLSKHIVENIFNVD